MSESPGLIPALAAMEPFVTFRIQIAIKTLLLPGKPIYFIMKVPHNIVKIAVVQVRRINSAVQIHYANMQDFRYIIGL
jgi:hypothetical protein